MIVDEGIQHMMDTEFSGGTPVTTWYLGLTDGTPTPADDDTLASHSGWVEVTDYSGDRKEWVEVRSGESMTNSASKASFTIDDDSITIGGCFLCSAATGTSGTLMSVVAFTGGDETADTGNVVEVTYTLSIADS